MGEKTVKAPEGPAWVRKTRIVEGEKTIMVRKGLTALGLRGASLYHLG
jgi:hypothetical protein